MKKFNGVTLILSTSPNYLDSVTPAASAASAGPSTLGVSANATCFLTFLGILLAHIFLVVRTPLSLVIALRILVVLMLGAAQAALPLVSGLLAPVVLRYDGAVLLVHVNTGPRGNILLLCLGLHLLPPPLLPCFLASPATGLLTPASIPPTAQVFTVRQHILTHCGLSSAPSPSLGIAGDGQHQDDQGY